MARNRAARYEPLARKAAAKYGIPVKLFLSLIDHESSWDPNATSYAGAIGLAQLMPGTAQGLKVDPWNPKQNLDGGARYLKKMYDGVGGNWKDALRAYNQGPSGWKRSADAGLEYAQSVLGGRNAQRQIDQQEAGGGGGGGGPRIKPPMGTWSKGSTSRSMAEMIGLLWPEDREFADLAKAVGLGEPLDTGPRGPTGVTGADPAPYPTGPGGKTIKYSGGGLLQLPTSWKATPHAGNATSNLGWGATGPADIMAPAGTRVGAPVDGVIERHGSAQGGSAMYFRGSDGRTYWIGHIDNMLPEGTRVKKGQVIAVVSSKHASPHVHIDAH